MPLLSANPNKTVNVFLPSDADRPEAERTQFAYRVLTCSQWTERSERRAALSASQTEGDYLSDWVRVLSIGLAGWHNLTDHEGRPIPFDPARPEAMLAGLAPQELTALFNAVSEAQTIGPEAKKN